MESPGDGCVSRVRTDANSKFGQASGWIAMSDLISLRMHEIPKAVVLIPFTKLHDAEVSRDLVSGTLGPFSFVDNFSGDRPNPAARRRLIGADRKDKYFAHGDVLGSVQTPDLALSHFAQLIITIWHL